MSDGVRIKTTIGDNNHFQNREQLEPYVDLDDEKSIKKWANVLQISQNDLKKAVEAYGPKIKKIRLGLAVEAREREKAA